MPIFDDASPFFKQLPNTEETFHIMGGFSLLPEVPNEETHLAVEALRVLLRPNLVGPNATDAHKLLLLLAEYAPLNVESLTTFDPIEPEDAIFIASGQQYSLTEIVGFHYGRPDQGELNEAPNSKWLMDPLTNEKFSSLDAAHIIEVAMFRGFIIEDLKIQELELQESGDSEQEWLYASDESMLDWEDGSLDSVQGSLDERQALLGSDQAALGLAQEPLRRTPRQNRLAELFRFLGSCCGRRGEHTVESASTSPVP